MNLRSDLRINDEMAEDIWNVLVERAGAPDSRDHREMFVHYAAGRSEVQEYRFMGSLGMGGKVRINAERWRVDYYPEDKTDLRETFAANANHDLKELRQTWMQE